MRRINFDRLDALFDALKASIERRHLERRQSSASRQSHRARLISGPKTIRFEAFVSGYALPMVRSRPPGGLLMKRLSLEHLCLIYTWLSKTGLLSQA